MDDHSKVTGGEMSNTFLELDTRLQMEALISEREGMIAENKQREYLGQAMAYVEDSFLMNSKLLNDLVVRWRDG